ncbi:hypothetical protein Sjap_004619 [Stephania japonica]|uniref:Uncharacterized protein n=1 Tax=Stephania japonica TaxID=461633 RepID=A0AAP0PL29_9MAGN
MASSTSIALSAFLQRACDSHHVIRKQHSVIRNGNTLGAVAVDVEKKKPLSLPKHEEKEIQSKSLHVKEQEVPSSPSFNDDRWKKGTWDLNMFAKDGKMDWNGVILAEARRRKFLEVYPEASTNEAPVTFRSSIIPWWAWLQSSYLPEAELLNGRAAMIGFFSAYFVDVFTGLDVVGQTGNFICKAGLFVTVIGIILFRHTEDFGNLRKLIEEATFYDKQWQATWQDQNASNDSAK